MLKKIAILPLFAMFLLPVQHVHAFSTEEATQTILDNMAEAESVEIEFDLLFETKSEHTKEPIIVEVNADVGVELNDDNKEGYYNTSMMFQDQFGETQNSEMEIIETLENVYLSQDGQWYFFEKYNAEDDMLMMAAEADATEYEDVNALIADQLAELVDRGVITISENGSEFVNGTYTLRYSYHVDTDKLVDYYIELSGEGYTSEETTHAKDYLHNNVTVSGDIWIDPIAMLPVQLTLNVYVIPAEDVYVNVEMTLLFKSFNKEIQVTAPANALPLEEFDESEDLGVASSALTATIESIDTDADGVSNSEETLYGADPTKWDTDEDGYSDATEIKSGYNPNGSGILDSDQDGLSNYEENLYGTSKYSADTDGDGYSDYTEVVNGYNPNGEGMLDSDADGLSDYAERNIHWTDPMNADTDGDGFNDGTEVVNGYDPNGLGRW